ncbi:PAS domain S-box protein [bacterium]|nr:PAS domain S-box protein [bacterium]
MKTKIVIMVALLVLVWAVVINVVISSYYQKKFKESITDQQFTFISLMAEGISKEITKAQNILTETSKWVTPDIINDPEKAQSFLDSRTGLHEIYNNGIFFLSTEGKRIAESPFKLERRGLDVSNRDYYKYVMAYGKPYISAPYISTQEHHHPSIMLACPIRDNKGLIIGIFEGSIDLMRGSFLEELSKVKIGKTGYISLYTQDGVRIMHPDKNLIMEKSNDKMIEEGFEGTIEMVTGTDVPVLRIYKKVEKTQWVLTANYPVSEAYKPVITAKKAFYWVGTAIVFTIGIFTWLLVMKLFQPIISLSDQVKKIGTSSERNKKVTIASKDEIGSLAENINIMLDDIESTQNDLRKSEESLDITLNSIGDGIIAADIDGCVSRLNPVAEVLTGWRVHDALGRSIEDIFPIVNEVSGNSEISPVDRIMNDVKDSGITDYAVLRAKDHTERLISYICSPIRNKEDIVNGVVIVFRDITESRKAEKKMNFQATILENMTDLVICTDFEGTIIYTSPSVLKANRSDYNQFMNQNICKVFKRIFTNTYIPEIFEKTKSGGWRGELQYTMEGEHRYISVQSTVMYDENQSLVALIFVGRDITRDKLDEEERTRMALAVEQANEAIYITDTEGIINYVNPAFERITGYSRSEALEHTPDFINSEFGIQFFQNIMLEKTKKCEEWRGQITYKRKDGKLIEVETTISPVCDSNRNVFNYLVINRDVTQVLKLEQMLRQAQKMEAIGTLAGGIAHDFNNILFAIVGYTEMAMTNISTESATGKYLKEVLRAGDRAKELIKQILAFSRQIEAERRPIQIQPVVKESLKLLQATLPKTIKIKQNINSNCGVILADPTQIHQVLMNLCTNAFHAMKDHGGVLDVSLSQITADKHFIQFHPNLKERDYVVLKVSDTGTGMDKLTMERIFEPYFSTKSQGEGTGLGLATVHGIVKNHGGDISVYSEPGKGTIFHVYFPRVDEHEQTKNHDKTVLPGGNERILFIDDEEQLTNLIKRMLEHLGYKVTAYNSCVDALDVFRTQPDQFDLVITDYMMPNMNGMDLSREIIKIRKDIPVILISGFGDMIHKEKLNEIGIKEVIMKPILTKDLAITIRKFITK